jgi:hypothetical protein
MREFELAHVSDAALLRDLAALITQERMTTAALLAHLAEVDARRLYVPAGYSSMHGYCVGELRLSEDAAYKRIQAARACRQFPILFQELSNGRLHLAAVCLLAPHLTPDNARELIAAALNRRKSEVEELIARRLPGSRTPLSSPATIRRVALPGPRTSLAMDDLLNTSPSPARDLGMKAASANDLGPQLAPGQLGDRPASSIATTEAPPPVDREPQVVERFEVRVTIDRATYERLRYAQTLMSHAVPNGDLGQILGRAVEALITVAERQKFGSRRSRVSRSIPTSRPIPALEAGTGTSHCAPSARPDRTRYIPADVRRAIWQRDQGQCTFISASGHRCHARRLLEFDHVEPVARGGRSTVEGLRLRCRAHNQYEAERAFGRGFMAGKREEARGAPESRRAWPPAGVGDLTPTRTQDSKSDVVSGLRNLGCRSDEARRAAEYAEGIPGATLDEKMRAALTYLRPSPSKRSADRCRTACPGAG